MEKEVSLYKKFIKKYSLDSPDNTYLIRTALLSPEKDKMLDIDSVSEAWRDFLDKDFHRSEIRFYNHIPFCHQRCSFCCYSSDRIESPSKVESYVDDLIEHYRFFSPVFKGRKFLSLYFGGGTPSVLSVDQMKKLFGELFSSFDFEDDGQKCIEFNPSTFSSEKIRVVREFGFNKISFGVQSFSPDVLKVNGRGYQSERVVEKAVSEAKNAGIETVSIDLLSGLYGDSGDDLVESVKKAVGLGPDTIYIYSVQPTDSYLRDVCKMSEVEFWKHKKSVLGSASSKVFEVACENGYQVCGSDGLNLDMRKRDVVQLMKENSDPKARFIPRKKGSSSIFGMGRYSHSYIYKRMSYTINEAIDSDPKNCRFLTNPYDERKDMLLFLYSGLAYGNSISLTQFKDNFDRDFFDEFSETTAKLKKMDAFRIDGDKLHVNSDNNMNWMIFLLFFVGEEEVEKVIAKPLPKISLMSENEL